MPLPPKSRSTPAAVLLALACLAPAATHAANTALEMEGLLLDLQNNRITGMGFVFEEVLYDSATGGTALHSFGPGYVDVIGGNFYQRLQPVDDALLSGPTFLQLQVNGFAMTTRLQVLSFEGRYWVEGHARQEALFQVYTGYAIAQAVPEPATPALLCAGLATLLGVVRRRRGRAG